MCAVQEAPFEFYDPKSPIYTSPRFLPPAKLENCDIKHSIISHGCTVKDSTIDHAVVGLRSHIDAKCTIRVRLPRGVRVVWVVWVVGCVCGRGGGGGRAGRGEGWACGAEFLRVEGHAQAKCTTPVRSRGGWVCKGLVCCNAICTPVASDIHALISQPGAPSPKL